MIVRSTSGIPEDEVGVAARRDHALARVEAGDAAPDWSRRPRRSAAARSRARATPSEKPMMPRVSMPTWPPGVDSMSVPAILTAYEVVYSSVASVDRRPSARPRQSASQSCSRPEAHADVVLRAVGLGVVVEREAHAVVQHLAVDRLPGRPPRRDRLERRLAADVREVDGCACVLGQRGDRADGELLAPVRVHEVGVARARVRALPPEPGLHVLDQVVVLGVHHRHRAEPRALLEQRPRTSRCRGGCPSASS